MLVSPALRDRSSPTLELTMQGALRPSHGRDKRATSNDAMALQFYWQGYQAFAHSFANLKTASCLYHAQCGCSRAVGADADAEAMHIVPLNELRERSILDDMKVQIVSTSTGRFLRASRMTKFLQWSELRDEQTVFCIRILDQSRSVPLTWDARYTLMSAHWDGYYVGFTQAKPLHVGQEARHAIGFLTLEKKKHQPPLLFPVRFRAVRAASRLYGTGQPASPASSASNFSPSFSLSPSLSASPSPSPAPIPLATTDQVYFIDDDRAQDPTDIPLAEENPIEDVTIPVSTTPVPDQELCLYCSAVFRRPDALLAHIRDYHGDWVNRESVPGRYCTQCGQRKRGASCRQCDRRL